METPFVFGKFAAEKNFTNRDMETEQLSLNFSSLINTILISPRRWGKSSLVKRAAEIAGKRDKSLRFCFIDLYNARTEEQFYLSLSEEILKAATGKVGGLLENAKKFMGRFIPRISFSPDSISDFSLSLDWEEVKKRPDDILNLAENIAMEKKLKFVVCIDEFQNIANFEDPLSMQKKLRSHWQKHQHAAYCLYGSKRHMLMDVFTSPSMPFYKFGDIIFLEKIKKEDWLPFLQNRFTETGKKIHPEEAIKIIDLAECHPYYVQQLAQLSWLRSKTVCKKETVATAHEGLVLQLSMLFQTITDGLSNTQVNFLKALLSGAELLTSQKTLEEFNLGTSANITKIKQALVNKEIIDIQGSNIDILDPMYKHWLKKYYFRI